MTEAYFAHEARAAIAAFDPQAGVSEAQIEKIVEDLDGWNQDEDRLIERQFASYDNQARLADIIEKRTGLTYAKAPVFFQKMEQVFLHRHIPIAPVRSEEMPAERELGTPPDPEVMAALSGWVAWSGGKTGTVVNVEANDGALSAQLQNILKNCEAKNSKGMNVLQSGQLRALLKDVETLEQRRGAVASSIAQLGGPQSERVLSHPSLRGELGVLRHSRVQLENMVKYYWNGGKVRESDLITVRRYIGALGSLNRGLQTLPRQLPTQLTPLRAAAASAPVSSLRQASQGLRLFMGRWAPSSRATAWGAGAVAAGALLVFGLEAAASAFAPSEPRGIEIIKPVVPQDPETPAKPAEPAAREAGKTYSIDELPNDVPTIDVNRLPSANHPRARARRK